MVVNRFLTSNLSTTFAFFAVAALSAGLSLAPRAAWAWSLEEAAKPYQGVEIRTICDGYAPCLANKELAPEFTEITGIEVLIEVGDLFAMQTQMFADALTEGQFYDFVQVQSPQIAVWKQQGFTTPMSRFLDDSNLRDPNLKIEDFIPASLAMTSIVDDELIGFPFHYIPAFEILRTDLVAHPEERAAFEAKYGYDLPAPELVIQVDTWEQWRDMAAFFTRKKGQKLAGQVLEKNFYGVAVPFKRHLTVFYDYMRILHGMGGAIMDEKFNVKLDSPEALKALEFMLSLGEFSPPGYKEFTWDEEYTHFCNGVIFTTFSWGDTTPFEEIKEDCPASAGNISYFVHPGTRQSAAWGSGWLIPKTARNPEAAFLFIQWSVSKEIQAKATPSGWLPTRSDVLRMPEWQNDPMIAGAMKIHQMLIDEGWLVTVPQHPAMFAIMDIMMEELSAAGAGDQDAKTTVTNMARSAREAMGQE